MRTIIVVALAALVTLLPASPASAQEDPCPAGEVEGPEGCSKQAWVDDCPPDMMCAAGAGPDPGQCADGACTSDPDTPVDNRTNLPPGTCMGGHDADEECDDGVVYLAPHSDDATVEPHTEADVVQEDRLPARLALAAAGLALLAATVGLAVAWRHP